MTALTITLYIIGIIFLASLGIKFRWTIAPTAIEQSLARINGYSVTKSWPFGTWTIRIIAGCTAIYLTVKFVLILLAHA
jgi:hypothetical protein